MILKELNLVSFGKFKNKVINFHEGLNVVYGENESGKTTIHNFIEGMFYGFLKPYVKKKKFLDELDRFRPWNGEKYAGILTLQKGDRSYRIERDFDRKEVKVYDELTGKDITDEIDLGEKINIHLPGLYFFDFNCFVYRNTISIRQLGNKIDTELSKEIKDKLANIATSLDDEISVKNALSELEKRIELIGTEKAHKRPYGRAVKELESLQERRKEALQKKQEYEDTEERFLKLKDEIQNREGEIAILKAKLEKAKLLDMKRTYEEALRLKEEIQILEGKIEDLKEYSSLSEDDYYTALKLDNQLNLLDEEIDSLMERLKGIDAKIKDISEKDTHLIEEKNSYEQLYEDFSQYNQMEEEKNTLLINSLKNQLELANVQLKEKKEKKRKATIQSLVSAIVVLISLGLSPVNSIFLILAGISFIFAAYSLYSKSKLKREEKELDENLQKLKDREKEREERINSITEGQKRILEKYGCSSKMEFNRLYEDMRFKQASRNSLLNEIEGLYLQKKEAEELIEGKKRHREQLRYEFKALMEQNRVSSIDEFKDGLAQKRAYDNLVRDRENKLGLLDSILRNNNLEELNEKLVHLEDEYYEEAEQINIDEAEEKLKIMENDLSEIKYEYSKLEERMDILNSHIQELINIEEEIARVQRKIEKYREEIQSAKIAKEVIESLSERIHKQFAPEINRNVSQLISFVTDGKYGNIKIDDNLDVTVENPSTGELISLESLSGGTIDQIYFALRFSLIDSMKKDNFPLILDDCFIQYDDRRLENILKFLVKLSERNQVILFTCHTRERDMLNKIKAEYNFVSLN